MAAGIPVRCMPIVRPEYVNIFHNKVYEQKASPPMEEFLSWSSGQVTFAWHHKMRWHLLSYTY